VTQNSNPHGVGRRAVSPRRCQRRYAIILHDFFCPIAMIE
jgi:hypothetical protein